MQSITRIENLMTGQPESKVSAQEDTIQTLEHFIDRMVMAENKLSKAAAQAAITQRQIREEFEKRIAFLSSQLHEAESALAALEASLSRGAMTPGDHELLTTQRGEVEYWRTKLHQVQPPDHLNFSV